MKAASKGSYKNRYIRGAGIGEGNTPDSAFAEAKAILFAMTVEANELKGAVGGSVTDAVAGWLAPQYALAALEQILPLEGEARLKLLREFVQDWALLRQGDQTAERLRIERDRLEVMSRNADSKWKRKVIIGLETLMMYAEKHPKAKAAMDELRRQVRHPFDPTESELIRPNPTDEPD
jgi:hypothetical protein